MPPKSKKQGRFMQAVANNPEFANKVGVNQSIGREFTQEKEMKKVKKMQMGGVADREGRAMATGRYANDPRLMADARGRAMKAGGKVKKMRDGGNTSRENRIEELGRVDAERADTTSGNRNLRDEKRRIRGELGMKHGGATADKMGRALAKDSKGMTASQLKDAGGRALATGGMLARTGGSAAEMKAKGKAMKKGGKVQGYNARLDDSLGARHGKKKQSLKSRRNESKGAKKAAGKKAYSGNRKSAQGNASKRADGIAQRGHTKGRIV